MDDLAAEEVLGIAIGYDGLQIARAAMNAGDSGKPRLAGMVSWPPRALELRPGSSSKPDGRAAAPSRGFMPAPSLDELGTDRMTQAGSTELRAEDVLAWWLMHAVSRYGAGHTPGIRHFVLAVPGHFGDAARRSIRAAATIAGLIPHRIVTDWSAWSQWNLGCREPFFMNVLMARLDAWGVSAGGSWTHRDAIILRSAEATPWPVTNETGCTTNHDVRATERAAEDANDEARDAEVALTIARARHKAHCGSAVPALLVHAPGWPRDALVRALGPAFRGRVRVLPAGATALGAAVIGQRCFDRQCAGTFEVWDCPPRLVGFSSPIRLGAHVARGVLRAFPFGTSNPHKAAYLRIHPPESGEGPLDRLDVYQGNHALVADCELVGTFHLPTSWVRDSNRDGGVQMRSDLDGCLEGALTVDGGGTWVPMTPLRAAHLRGVDEHGRSADTHEARARRTALTDLNLRPLPEA